MVVFLFLLITIFRFLFFQSSLRSAFEYCGYHYSCHILLCKCCCYFLEIVLNETIFILMPFKLSLWDWQGFKNLIIQIQSVISSTFFTKFPSLFKTVEEDYDMRLKSHIGFDILRNDAKVFLSALRRILL